MGDYDWDDRTQYREPEPSGESIANGLTVGEVFVMVWHNRRILMRVTSVNAEINAWEATSADLDDAMHDLVFPLRVVDDNFPPPEDPVWADGGADADDPLGD